MPIYSRTITVKGDIESAFNFVADFRNLDQWDTASTAELITNEPISCLLYTSDAADDA